MRVFATFLIFILASLGHTAPSLAVCPEMVRAQLQMWGSLEEWIGEESPLAIEKRFRTPTTELSQWVELWTDEKTYIEIRREVPEHGVSRRFLKDNCTAIPKTRVHSINDSEFTDVRLREVMKRDGRGAIFLWSPQSPFSQGAVANVQKAGRSLKIPINFVLDPGADKQLARRSLKKFHLDSTALRKMESLELTYRGILRHVPTMVLFHNQKIVGFHFPGAKTASEYTEIFRKHLSDGELSR